MLQKDLKKGLKKGGVKMSESSKSSRVKGWTNSCSTGWELSEVYPWYTRYVRNGHYLWSYLHDRTQTVGLDFTDGFTLRGSRDVDESFKQEEFNKVRSVLNGMGVNYKETKEGFDLEVDNPYSEEKVNRGGRP